jgi:hypothetical protein
MMHTKDDNDNNNNADANADTDANANGYEKRIDSITRLIEGDKDLICFYLDHLKTSLEEIARHKQEIVRDWDNSSNMSVARYEELGRKILDLHQNFYLYHSKVRHWKPQSISIKLWSTTTDSASSQV